MTDQLTLGLDDRHAGQAANLAAGTKGYRDDTERVKVALDTLIRSGTTFTAHTVYTIVQLDGGGAGFDKNLISSRIGRAAQDGVIVHTGQWVNSPRRCRHASKIKEWRGNKTRIPDQRDS
ncbi:hypothetical protein CFN78_06945 [Amycolatopsis antarctica]|uniref:Uncharacterized protein n=1 Tax=Amycolatopsis antarctica TaxID=1854586 RepID=A0A263D7N0_9PSEU|nr:hypothetical protein CFN78_06945 [Amycolatopsis antarctica]